MIALMQKLAGRELKEMNRYALLAVLEALLASAPLVFCYLLFINILQGAEKGLTIWQFALGAAICLVLRFWVGKWLFIRSNLLGYGAGRDIRLRLGEHLEKLPLGFFERRGRFGDVSNALLGDVALTESLFSYLYIQIVSISALTLIMALSLFLVDWRLASVLIAPILIGGALAFLLRRKVMGLSSLLRQAMGELNDSIIEYVRTSKTLKAYNLAGERYGRLRKAIHRVHRRMWRTEVWGSMPVFTFTSFAELGFPLLVILACHLWLQNNLTLSVLVFFLVVSLRVIRPVQSLAVFMSEESAGVLAGQRLEEILDEPDMTHGTQKLPTGPWEIRFEDVCFGYGPRQVLHDINLAIAPNTVTALVGPSGAGKTTLANLIARFWDVNSGSITLGGMDLRELDDGELMNAVSMVFQEVYFFNDTVMRNLRVANPAANQQEVHEACRLARCHDFIQALPMGYQTVLGEGGGTLSGGERQRLSLARAMLKDAPIVLLDEATASLDPENELNVQEAIANLVEGRTLVVIAHRLYSIAEADQIIVLNKGRVAERGRHEDLLGMDGLYSRMWRDQQSAGRWKMCT